MSNSPHKKQILLVEDNPDHAYLAKFCLEKNADYQVVEAKDAHQCSSLLKVQNFDIVLLDYNLPDKNGLEVLRELKDGEISSPIVLVTGHGHERVAVEALKAGAFDYVVKSAEYPSFLPNLVRRVLDKYRIVQEKRRIESEIVARNNELEVLNSVSEVVNKSLVVDEILKNALNKLMQKLVFDTIAVYFVEGDRLSLKVGGGRAHKSAFPKKIELAKSGISRKVMVDGQYEIFSNQGAFPSCFSENLVRNDITSLICVPLKHAENLVGLVFGGCFASHRITQPLGDLMTSVCNQICTAVENARLYAQTEKLKNNFENVLQSSLDAIVTVRQDGTITFFNEKFTDLLGKPGPQIFGYNILDLVPDDTRSLIESKLKLLEGDASVYEAAIYGKSDESLPCLVSQSHLRGRDESLLLIKDLAMLARLQEQLLRTDKMAALGRMIAGAAHELNNPLAGILGYVQLLLEEDLSPQIRKDIMVIQKESRRCQEIVQNLLIFARKRHAEKHPVNVNKVLTTVLGLNRYQLGVDSITTELNYNQDLPMIVGDFQQLQQVFLHIITNAHFALREDDKETKVLTIATSYTAESVVVAIADNGIGIPAENMSRIFDPFFTTREIGEGTGLGLSICYGIVENHGGRLSVESEIGVGSTFVVEFPVARKQLAADSTDADVTAPHRNGNRVEVSVS
jgi:two-component system NtrC family sensor kinase